jgi:hypothetical protein
MRDHQPRQLGAVDQNYPGVDPVGVLLGVGAEGGGGVPQDTQPYRARPTITSGCTAVGGLSLLSPRQCDDKSEATRQREDFAAVRPYDASTECHVKKQVATMPIRERRQAMPWVSG